jgi:hypothetical protein
MKNISLSKLALGFLALTQLAGFSIGQTEDKNTILQIAQGDKLVAHKDLNVPANTERIYFGLKIDSGTINSGCALVVVPSNKSRRIVVGAELVFSGISHSKKVLNQYKHTDYTYTAEMMGSQAVSGLECYGTSFQSQFQDLYVQGMRNELKEHFDFAPAEPEIIQ